MRLEDRKLPAIARALDAEAMRAVLATALDCANDLLEAQPRVLKHAPGKRCVLRYDLRYRSGGHGPACVIGKMYRRQRGQTIFAHLRALWQAAIASNDSVLPFHLPEPLAYVPALDMVLQNFAAGKQMATLRAPEELRTAAILAAENLAALHELQFEAGEARTMTDHLKKYCHPGPEALAAACPELVSLLEEALAGLFKEENAALVPAHGDLGLAQIFIHEGRASFIDFDGFCRTHAALDVGNFYVTLQVHFGASLKELPELFLAREFLARYLACRGLDSLPSLSTYCAFAYLRRAMICSRWQAEPNWREQTRALLEAAARRLINSE